MRWGHFSKLGNGIVAAYIVERLGELKLDTRAGVEAAAAAERIRLTVAQSGDPD